MKSTTASLLFILAIIAALFGTPAPAATAASVAVAAEVEPAEPEELGPTSAVASASSSFLKKKRELQSGSGSSSSSSSSDTSSMSLMSYGDGPGPGPIPYSMKYYTDTKTKSSKKLYLDTTMSMSLVPYYEPVPLNGPYDPSSKKTKSSKNLDGKSAKAKEFSFASLPDDWNPGECAVGVPWRGCGSGAVCWRWRDRPVGSGNGPGDWYGNGVCIPSTWQRGGFFGLGGRWIPNECLPRDIGHIPGRLQLW